MRLKDVIHSCSHDHVAEAAVVSIGGSFENKVRSSAAEHGLSVGEFASRHVQTFSRQANERDWRSISSRMQGSDLALLAGLEAVVTRMMGTDGEHSAGH